MTDEQIAVALAEIKKEIGSLKHRVDDLEDLTKAINELSMSVRELAITVSNNNERMDSYEMRLKQQGERIGELEKKPSKQWDKLTGAIITVLVGGIIGYFLSNMGM